MIPERSNSRRRVARLVALLGVLVLTACSKDSPLNYLKPEGPVADEQDGLWRLTFGAATVVFFVVEGLLLYAIFRYRAKEGVRDLPKQTHGNNKMEVAWTLAPALLLGIITVPTLTSVFRLAEPPPANALVVRVIAHQWWWEYQYEKEKVVTANELHIPTDRPVHLKLESPDVIHSFWVPKLGGKQDVVPGRVNRLTLRAVRPGEYFGQCMEYCGLSHANMRLRVIAQEPDDFEAWVQDQLQPAKSPTSPLATRGQQLFLTEVFENGSCFGCHAVGGTSAQGTIGPNLTHFASRGTFAGSIFERNDETLRLWLENPPARKPGSIMPDLKLTPDQIEALIAYLNTLE